MDFNEDGKMDIVAGNEDGALWFFENKGTPEKPVLAAGVKIKAEGKEISGAVTAFKEVDGNYEEVVIREASSELAHLYSKIDVADWDDDGLMDILVGHDEGVFVLYRNQGEKGKPLFGKPEEIRLEGVIVKDGKEKPEEFPFRPSPLLVDWDGDGKKDLLVGSEEGNILFYPNQGDSKSPLFVSGTPLKAEGEEIKKGTRIRVEAVDWNNDGKLDLVAGNYEMARNPETRKVKKGGNIWLFLQK